MKPLILLLASAAFALGANPYLHLPDDKPVVHEFKGEEWDQDRIGINEKGDGSKRAPLTATVTTLRLETMPWGEIYRITFKVLPAASERNVGPHYLLVTDNEILELSSADMEREVRVIRGMKKQPRFDKSDVAALTKGALKFKEGPWVTEITIKGRSEERRVGKECA